MSIVKHTFLNRPTGSTDPKYKADGTEVNENFIALEAAIAFIKVDVDVSAASSGRNCQTSNSEYGASTTSQCNLTCLLADVFNGKIVSTAATGDVLGICDNYGRFWVVTLAENDQISFGEGEGGSANKCTWTRLDNVGAFSNYNDEAWMNTLTVWHIKRSTDDSNITRLITVEEILLGTGSHELSAADIILADSGGYFTTDQVEAALQEMGAHKADNSDPHGATLTQTNLSVTGTTSANTLAMSGNLAINTNKFTVAASTGNTVIAGTLTVAGAISFNANVTIGSTYSLTIGSGGITATGDITTSTKVKTPEIRNDGDVTIDAYSASGSTKINLKNSGGGYADAHLDHLAGIIWDTYNGTLRMDSDYLLHWSFYSNTPSWFVIDNDLNEAWLYVKTGIRFGADSPVIKIYKSTDYIMDFDIYSTLGDTTLYIKNTASGKKASLDIEGNLNVQDTITGDNAEVVTARGIYENLDARITAISLGGGSPESFVPGQTKLVAKSGTDYQTIQSAITAITDATASKPYVVMIYPGVYNEIITMKAYVYLVGVDRNACQIVATTNDNMINVNVVGKTRLFNLYLKGYSDKAAVYVNNSNSEIYINGCELEPQGTTTGYGIHVPTGYNPTIWLNDSQMYSTSVKYGIYCDGSAAPYVEIRNSRIKITTSGCSNYISGNILNIYNSEIITDGNAIETTGNVYIYNSKIESLNGEAFNVNATVNCKFYNSFFRSVNGIHAISAGSLLAYNCIFQTTGTNKSAFDLSSAVLITNLVGCFLRAVGVSAYSIYSSSSVTVIMSNCTVNKDVGVNVTVTPGTVWQTTNALNANLT